MDIDKLSALLEYRFANNDLLKESLTHPSIGQNLARVKKPNYERLELLGDTVLALVVTELLITTYPEDDEGALARKRSTLICGNVISDIATKLGIQEYIIMSDGEEKLGGRNNPSILENIIEALLGAMYLDGGLEICKIFISKFWTEAIKNAVATPIAPKAFLQEWAQKHGKTIPVYTVTSRDGPSHKPTFTVEVIMSDMPPQQAQGGSRKIAEKLAAQQLVNMIKEAEDGK